MIRSRAARSTNAGAGSASRVVAIVAVVAVVAVVASESPVADAAFGRPGSVWRRTGSRREA
jgi:hypothetical protein